MTGKVEQEPKRVKLPIPSVTKEERKALREAMKNWPWTSKEETEKRDRRLLEQLRRNNTTTPNTNASFTDGMVLGGFLGVVFGFAVGLLIGVIVS